MSLDQLAGELASAKTLLPEPLILFAFTRHSDRSELVKVKLRIAGALGCSNVKPCIEGTPEQLR